MTWILDHHKHRLDGRSYQDRIGRPYYGPNAMRKIVTPDNVRADIRYFWLVVFFGAIAAVALGMLAAL